MTVNTGSPGPAHIGGSARQAARQAPEAKLRPLVLTFVALAAAARWAADKRTVQGAIVLAIAVAAAGSLGKERGTPGLDRYLGRERDKRRS